MAQHREENESSAVTTCRSALTWEPSLVPLPPQGRFVTPRSEQLVPAAGTRVGPCFAWQSEGVGDVLGSTGTGPRRAHIAGTGTVPALRCSPGTDGFRLAAPRDWRRKLQCRQPALGFMYSPSASSAF